MTPDVLLGWLRHVLTALGGAFVLKGWTDEGTMTGVVGAVMTLVGFAWSWYAKVNVTPVSTSNLKALPPHIKSELVAADVVSPHALKK